MPRIKRLLDLSMRVFLEIIGIWDNTLKGREEGLHSSIGWEPKWKKKEAQENASLSLQ